MTTDQNILFITGARRTGTTLLYQILCSAPTTNPQIGEARIISRLLDTYKWGQDVNDELTQWFFPSMDAYHEMFQKNMDYILQCFNEKYDSPETIVFKTPAFYSMLDELRQFFASARFVICLRNPLDQVTSEYEVGLRQVKQGKRTNNKATDRDFRKMARAYMRHYNGLFDYMKQHPDNCHLVKYEDLILDTDSVVKQLETFTGLDLSSYNPNERWKNFSNEEVLKKMPAYVPQYGAPIDSSRVHRYKDVLTRDEIKTVNKLCEPIIKDYYPDLK